MKGLGLARIGRDTELRHTPKGDAVVNISLAFSWGRRGEDGNRSTTWVEASLWGKRAEALAPYLKKGGLVSVVLEEIHMETYESQNGGGTKIVGKVMDIELAGGGERTQVPAPAPARQQTRAPAPQPSSGFDDMDDDIPF